jgi:hypothetical protein
VLKEALALHFKRKSCGIMVLLFNYVFMSPRAAKKAFPASPAKAGITFTSKLAAYGSRFSNKHKYPRPFIIFSKILKFSFEKS